MAAIDWDNLFEGVPIPPIVPTEPPGAAQVTHFDTSSKIMKRTRKPKKEAESTPNPADVYLQSEETDDLGVAATTASAIASLSEGSDNPEKIASLFDDEGAVQKPTETPASLQAEKMALLRDIAVENVKSAGFKKASKKKEKKSEAQFVTELQGGAEAVAAAFSQGQFNATAASPPIQQAFQTPAVSVSETLESAVEVFVRNVVRLTVEELKRKAPSFEATDDDIPF